MSRKISYSVFCVSLVAVAFCKREEGGKPRVRMVQIDSAWAKNSVIGAIFRRDLSASDGQWQYVAYYDSLGHVVVGKRRCESDVWRLNQTEITGGAEDAHNEVSIAVDGNGLLYAAFGCHCTPLLYYVECETGSIELQKGELLGANGQEATYPEFYRLDNGDLLLTCRDGAYENTRLVLNRYDSASRKWNRVQDAVIETPPEITPYWQMCMDKRGGLYLTWVWRGVEGVESNHNMCYAYSPDGDVSWQRSDGSAYVLPIGYGENEVIAKIGPFATLINQGTIACGGNGDVYVATYYRGKQDSVVQYHVLHKTRNGWHDHCVSQRTMDFRLDGGGGTRGIPMSRPLIEARGRDCYLFCRDVEDGMRVGVYCGRCGREPWMQVVLTDVSVDFWEPTFDSWLWQEYGKLHLYVQRMVQDEGASGENLSFMLAQPNYAMEVEL